MYSSALAGDDAAALADKAARAPAGEILVGGGANSLAASNGSDCRGVELHCVRDLAARAGAAEALLRGLLDDGHDDADRTSVAMRVVLEATKDRVGTQRLARKEYRALTKDLLKWTLQSGRQAMKKAAASKSPTRVPKPVKGVPEAGPGWIPGAAWARSMRTP